MYMQKLFFKWRLEKYQLPMQYWDYTTGSWEREWYTLGFRFNSQRSWYIQNGVYTLLDTKLQNYKDVSSSGEARKDKLFGIIEYDETKIDPKDVAFDLECYTSHWVRVFTSEEAKAFLDSFADIRIENGVYYITEEHTRTLPDGTEEVVPAYTLTF